MSSKHLDHAEARTRARSRRAARWRVMGLLVLVAFGVAPAEAQRMPAGVAPASAVRSGDLGAVRARADRITRTLRRAASGRGRGAALRYVRRGFARDVDALTAELSTAPAATTPNARLRAAAAIARAVRAAGALEPDAALHEGADRTLADATADARTEHHESAVEVEAETTDAVIDAMTTDDGTVAPLLEELRGDAPDYVTRHAVGGAVARVSWDALTRDEKRALLRAVSYGRPYAASRRIPGVRMRDSARRDGADEGVLPYVEYMDEESVAEVSGVELHVRRHGAAADTYRRARALAARLAVEDPALHQHVTARIDPRVARGDAVARVRFVDFYRRVNVVAELRAVMAERMLGRVSNGPSTFFDVLHPEGLSLLDEHLHATAHGQDSRLTRHTQLKLAAVGFRTGELYGDSSLFGLEMRALTVDPDGHNDRFVDAVQRGIVGRRYGLAPRVMARWRARAVAGAHGAEAELEAESHALAALSYHRDLDDMLAHLPEGLTVDDLARRRLVANATENGAVKLLLHDFSTDPVFEGDPIGARTVRAAQAEALDELSRGRGIPDVMRRFVRNSGLYHAFAQSIGMEP